MTWLGHPDNLSHACLLFHNCPVCDESSKSGSGRSRTAAEEAQASPSFTPENPVTPRCVGFGLQGRWAGVSKSHFGYKQLSCGLTTRFTSPYSRSAEQKQSCPHAFLKSMVLCPVLQVSSTAGSATAAAWLAVPAAILQRPSNWAICGSPRPWTGSPAGQQAAGPAARAACWAITATAGGAATAAHAAGTTT
jgi:hypothetical protein